MNRIVALIFFLIIFAVLWWALNTVIAALALPAIVATLATVAFVLIAVFTAYDYLTSGTFFWTRGR